MLGVEELLALLERRAAAAAAAGVTVRSLAARPLPRPRLPPRMLAALSL